MVEVKKAMRDQERTDKSKSKKENANSGPAVCQYEWNCRENVDELGAKDKSTMHLQKIR